MASLEVRVHKKRVKILVSLLIFFTCASVELLIVYLSGTNLILSSATFLVGGLGLCALYWSLLKERQFVVSKFVENLNNQKSKSVETSVLKNVIEKDVRSYLTCTHLLTPKFLNSKTELQRVEGLENYLKDYRAHSDLNLLKNSSKEVLEENQKISISINEMIVDFSAVTAPFLLVVLAGEKNIFLYLLVLRALSFLAYGFVVYKNKKVKLALDRLNHFLFGKLNDADLAATRLELNKLKDIEEATVFFLIDHHRKDEIHKTLDFQTSGLGAFKDWCVISSQNSAVKSKANSKSAFVVFPSEMGFPYSEMKEFFNAFEKVIIIDSSPSYALDESAVFYLDHNQDIKRVHIDKNLERMSGDKGLILRNFKKHNVSEFLNLIEEKLKATKPCYLLYQSVEKNEDLDASQFVYPSGCKRLVISSALKSDVAEGYYCHLSKGSAAESLELAKNFIANCSYHQIYSNLAVQNKMKHSYRVS